MTDVIFYGALKPCMKCKNGNFIFGNSSYLCTGSISEWAKCDNVVKEPERQTVKIPKYIQEAHPFLGKKFKIQTRIVKDVPAYLTTKIKVKKDEKDDVDA